MTKPTKMFSEDTDQPVYPYSPILTSILSRNMKKTNKVAVRPAKTDQPGHLPSLIRVFAMHLMGS